ncbi:MAG: hypothetical protein IE884_05800 [Sulfuricurvum sp.]|nr:hypothetical protein [Sulfuricurvum sp.]
MSWQKEVALLAAIFVLTALGVHPDLLSTPTARFDTLVSQGAYWHPFLFSIAIYLILTFIRYTIHMLRKMVYKFISK